MKIGRLAITGALGVMLTAGTSRIEARNQVGIEIGNSDLLFLKIAAGTRGETDLYMRDQYGNTTYDQAMLPDVLIWNNLILGRTSEEIIFAKGWEFTALETFTYRTGRHYDYVGRIFNRTEGFTIESDGLFHLLASGSRSRWGAFLLNHLSIRYSRAIWMAGRDHPVSGTTFQEWGIRFSR